MTEFIHSDGVVYLKGGKLVIRDDNDRDLLELGSNSSGGSLTLRESDSTNPEEYGIGSAPGRELGYAEVTSNATSTSVYTAVTDIVGLSVTVTVGARPIVVEFGCLGLQHSLDGGESIASIREGSTEITACRADSPQVNGNSPGYCRRRLAPSAGVHTYKVSLSVLVSGTASILATATSPAWIQVTEV